MAEHEDPWRERGRAAIVGLILALGVVAMVLLGGRDASPAAEWPPVAGVYRVSAECRGCDCEPAGIEGLAVVHPGLPIGRPTPGRCETPDACLHLLERRAPPNVRAPVVLEPGAEPSLLERELNHGPPLTQRGKGFGVSVTRERREAKRCIRVRRTRELMPEAGSGWRWTERYESAEGATCPPPEELSCVAATVRRIAPLSP